MERRLDKAMEDYWKVENNLYNIINLIKDTPLSISDISKKLIINRSTIRHYIRLLIKDNRIILDKKKDLPGRPVFVKVNKQFYETEWNDFKKRADEYKENIKTNPYTQAVLNLLKEGKITHEELLIKIRDMKLSENYTTEIFRVLWFLQKNKYAIEGWEITDAGKKFLEENSQVS